METLEELKAIIDNAPHDATHACIESGTHYYFKVVGLGAEIYTGDDWLCYSGCALPDLCGVRFISDIKRIIELMDESEPKKEECKHPSSTASYTHVTCDSCYMIRTDGGWGCASRKWFDNIESAKFYEKNGFLPR